MYDEYVSLRVLRLFFFSSPPLEAAGLEVFFAAFAPSVVFAGALEAVEAGALPAVEAGLGAIVGLLWTVRGRGEKRARGRGGCGGRGTKRRARGGDLYVVTRDVGLVDTFT